MNQIRLKAFAKINLGLDVVGRRENGYHDVRMIMQTVRLFDKLTMKKLSSDQIILHTNLVYLPDNENNLVYKAVDMLKKEFHIKKGVEVTLEKHIPVSAGMAGGSTDCAAALFGMNKLFDLGLSLKELMEIGVKLGADVPYCIMRGTALSEGIGEVLTPLAPMPPCYIVIAKPGISVSTRFVYENLNLKGLTSHPDIDGMIDALEQGSLNGVADRLENVLETVTTVKYPVINKIKKRMKENGALNALMSGSGPTVFGIFDDQSKGERVAEILRREDMVKQVYLVEPFNK